MPVLAGSGAFALSDALSWQGGLERRLLQAKAFYATIAVSTMAGVGLNFTPLNPVKALYWSAVVNGVLAAPVMAAVMAVAGNGRIMGRLTVSKPLLAAGMDGDDDHAGRQHRLLRALTIGQGTGMAHESRRGGPPGRSRPRRPV